jgi:hypothetical protein
MSYIQILKVVFTRHHVVPANMSSVNTYLTMHSVVQSQLLESFAKQPNIAENTNVSGST